MRHITMYDLRQLLLVGICKIQVTAQHGNIHMVPGKDILYVHGKPGGHCLIRGGKLVNHLRQRKMPALKTQLTYLRDPLLKR